MASGHKDVALAIYALWDLRVDFLAVGVGVTVGLMIEAPIHFTLITGLIYTYVMHFSTCYLDSGGATPYHHSASVSLSRGGGLSF